MGLITCSKCGRIYDYEKYNGNCPKCARYNRENSAAAEHQEYHDKYDGGYNHSAQDDHHSYHQRYDDNKNPHANQLSGKKTNKKAILIIGIVFLVLFLIPFMGPLAIVIAISAAATYAKRKKK